MGWIHAGTNGRIEESQEEFLRSQKASCRNAKVKVGEDVYDGFDVINGMRHVKVYGDSWECKTGFVFLAGQESPVWQDEKWSHWELDPGEVHAEEAKKGDFHYEI